MLVTMNYSGACGPPSGGGGGSSSSDEGASVGWVGLGLLIG